MSQVQYRKIRFPKRMEIYETLLLKQWPALIAKHRKATGREKLWSVVRPVQMYDLNHEFISSAAAPKSQWQCLQKFYSYHQHLTWEMEKMDDHRVLEPDTLKKKTASLPPPPWSSQRLCYMSPPDRLYFQRNPRFAFLGGEMRRTGRLWEEIRRSPVEVGSLSHDFQGFIHPRLGDLWNKSLTWMVRPFWVGFPYYSLPFGVTNRRERSL